MIKRSKYAVILYAILGASLAFPQAVPAGATASPDGIKAPDDAAGKRKIDFGAIILDNFGKPVPDTSKWPRDPKTHQPIADLDPALIPPLTLGAFVASLLGTQDASLTLVQAYKRGELGSRVVTGEKLWLSAEETALIVSLLPKSGSPLAVYRSMQLLGEPAPR